MHRITMYVATAMLTALAAGCASTPPGETGWQGTAPEVSGRAPSSGGTGNNGQGSLAYSEMLNYEAITPVQVNLADVPRRSYDPLTAENNPIGGGEMEMPISEEEAERLRDLARQLPPQRDIQGPGEAGPGSLSPIAGVAFDALDTQDCCGGAGAVVPPDPELAVGENHLLVVVNLAFALFDKSGTNLTGAITFADFFTPLPTCTGEFDPNAVYDEETGRYIMGVDGNGTHYCLAVSAGPDPLGVWYLYAFATNVGGNFFDYPHTGVGRDAIYMGANMFGASFVEGRVWAMDKYAAYAGAPMTVVSWSTGGQSTPQPMNLHGFQQGTWPVSGPHYILTDGPFDGANYGVFSWDDPFGANNLVFDGMVDLGSYVGIPHGFPLPVPQLGSGATLEANDWRVQDAEYRNGMIWMTSTVSCNPGSGSVDCVRWAQIDPTGPSIVDSGLFASQGEYRTFADLAVNNCNDMAVGYTKSTPFMYPGVFVTGRESFYPPGLVGPESELKAGEVPYAAFDGAPLRWGDYTGMTIDPNGTTFWYLGEYSKDITGSANWGTFVGSFEYPGCNEPLTKYIVSGNDVDNNGQVDRVVEAGINSPAEYFFVINYNNPGGPTVRIRDVVPREWNATYLPTSPVPCVVKRADSRRNLFSDNYITCQPGDQAQMLFVAEARCGDNPSAPECHPYECGAFFLNEGAYATAGRVPVEGPTDPICLAAVTDVNGGGLDYSGNGDEDGDGRGDYQEACVDFTNPCVFDLPPPPAPSR